MLGRQSNPSAAFNRESTGTLCIGGWAGPSVDLDGWVKSHTTGIRSRRVQPVASHNTDRAILSHICIICTLFISFWVKIDVFEIWIILGQPDTQRPCHICRFAPANSVGVFLRHRQPAPLQPKDRLQKDPILQNEKVRWFPSFPSTITNQ